MPRIPESEIERLKSEVSVERLVAASGFELKKSDKHNGLLRARPAFRSPSSLPPGMRATPVMSCAPWPARASARSTKPMPAQCRCSCAPGVPAAQVTGSGALRAQSWSWPPPAHRPPPEGAARLPPLSLPSGLRYGWYLNSTEYLPIQAVAITSAVVIVAVWLMYPAPWLAIGICAASFLLPPLFKPDKYPAIDLQFMPYVLVCCALFGLSIELRRRMLGQ